jgi:hypothetical protein
MTLKTNKRTDPDSLGIRVKGGNGGLMPAICEEEA